MTVSAFFQVAEVWVPDPVDSCLRLAGGSYGPHEEFRAVSAQQRFARGEGLPGRVWETGRPLVLGHLTEGSGFQRSEAAARANLSAGMAFPVVRKRRVQAIVVLLFGDAVDAPGIAEIWAPAPHGELRLQSGYFGTFDDFRRLSSALNIELGSGLPGSVWKTQLPELWSDVGRQESFLRAAAAASYDLTTGLAWPCDDRNSSIALLLATRHTPIALAVEVWAPDKAGELALVSASYTHADKLRLPSGSTLANPSDGFISRAYTEGFPTLLTRPEDLDAKRAMGSRTAHISRGVALPICTNDRVTAVVALMA